jgi:hypothetical protein
MDMPRYFLDRCYRIPSQRARSPAAGSSMALMASVSRPVARLAVS